MPKPEQMTTCEIHSWDEICNETTPLTADHGENEHDLPYTATNDEIIAYLRKAHGDENEDDEEPEYGWELCGIARTPRTAIIEWKSDRGHAATNTIIWNLDPL